MRSRCLLGRFQYSSLDEDLQGLLAKERPGAFKRSPQPGKNNDTCQVRKKAGALLGTPAAFPLHAVWQTANPFLSALPPVSRLFALQLAQNPALAPEIIIIMQRNGLVLRVQRQQRSPA